jgi:hypothetical protein
VRCWFSQLITQAQFFDLIPRLVTDQSFQSLVEGSHLISLPLVLAQDLELDFALVQDLELKLDLIHALTLVEAPLLLLTS